MLPTPSRASSLPATPLPTPDSPPAFDSLIPCIVPHPFLSTVQQPVRLRHVMHVRRCRSYAMNNSRLSVRMMCSLHPKVPLIPLLRLTHLRVSAHQNTILRRRRRLDDARVHDRSLPKPQSLGLQMTVDLYRPPDLPQLVLFQQMTEVQDRRLVRYSGPDSLRPTNRLTDSTS